MPDAVEPPPGAGSLLRRNPAFRNLAAARLISFVGDSLSLVALLLHVATSTGQALAAAALLLVGDFAPALLGPLSGALADRCSPCLAWAPAGDWVFFNRLGPGFAVGAYRLGRAAAVTVPVEVPGSLPPSLAVIRPE